MERLKRLGAHVTVRNATATPQYVHSMSSGRPTLEPAMRIVEQAVVRQDIPGASVLVMRNGEVLTTKSFGTRDAGSYPDALPFETDTVCYIASLTKPFTAAAAMLLVERGLLSLDDPVAKHLPAFAAMSTQDGRACLTPSSLLHELTQQAHPT